MGELSAVSIDAPFIVFGKPDIGQDEKDAVMSVLESGWLSTGRMVESFEEEFQRYLGEGFPVAVSSCTDGLILSLIAAGVSHGDHVITTPLTFAATANAIKAVGAIPVFVDTTPQGQIDPENIRGAITPLTRAIIPVHYTGAACDMVKIMSIARANNIPVIEDAAHGFGGFHVKQKKKIGTFGDYAVFSFYPTKNITSGEGGMVVCRNSPSATLIRTLSMQGLSTGAHRRYSQTGVKSYRVLAPGRKSNMSDIHAAIGITQLRRWPELRLTRFTVWKMYEDAFGKKEDGHSQHLFTIREPRRQEFRQFLYDEGIGTGIHFNPLHFEPGFASLGYEVGDFPNAEEIGLSTVSLPVSSTMTAEDAQRVIDAVHRFKTGGS